MDVTFSALVIRDLSVFTQVKEMSYVPLQVV